MGSLPVSVCIPAYNKSAFLRKAMDSVLGQDFQEFELLIVDDCSSDDTYTVAADYQDRRIRYFRNDQNLGLGRNLQRCADLSSGEILLLLCDDDILLPGALRQTYDAFTDPDVGVVTRPYYWFDTDVNVPRRAIFPPDRDHNCTLGIFDGRDALHALFRSAGQISGLAFRRRDLLIEFHDDIFPTHIYPFAHILRTRKAVFLQSFTVAARTRSSMTRSRPEIYEKSPTKQWIEMFESVYAGPEFGGVRAQGIDFICGTNFAGLIQLSTTGSRSLTFREIRLLLKRRPRNAMTPAFWAYAIGTMTIPPRLLRWLVDQYTTRVLARRVQAQIAGE